MIPLRMLFDEHKVIIKMTRVLKDMAVFIDTSRQISNEKLEHTVKFLKEFIGGFHIAKEEKFLFPMLRTKVVSGSQRMIDVLLYDHEQLSVYLSDIIKAMHEENQARVVNLLKISEIFHKYSAFLSKHITNENTTLFPIAAKLLSEVNYTDLNKQFVDFELKTIGQDACGRYEGIIERLTYGSFAK